MSAEEEASVAPEPPAEETENAAATEDDDDLFSEDAPDGAQNGESSSSKAQQEDDADDLFADDDVGGTALSEDSEDDLFKDSDDEEDEETSGRRRLSKGTSKRRLTKGVERFDQRRSRPSHAEEAKESFLEDEEAYASEEEVQATDEDRRFIADDDDHADIMSEYARDRQSWDDREFRGAAKRGGATRGAAGSGVTESAFQRLEDGPVKEVFAKKKRRNDMSNEEKEQFVQNFLREMSEAHAEDERIRSDPNIKQPALHKLQMLPKVVSTLQRIRLHNLLLDYDLLREMAKWIQPLDGAKKQLPNETVRTTFIQKLHDLPIEIDHLKRSGMGKVVMSLYKHPQESAKNKRSLKVLIERWARPIYQKSGSHLAHRADVDTTNSTTQYTADAGGRMNLNKSLGASAAQRKKRRKNEDDDQKPRLEFHRGYDFHKMPAPRMDRVQQASAQPRFSLKKKIDSKGRRRR